jgi:hypothetical protein
MPEARRAHGHRHSKRAVHGVTIALALPERLRCLAPLSWWLDGEHVSRRDVTACRPASSLLVCAGMALDLEDELLRAAYAMCARDRLDAFSCEQLVSFIADTAAYPRLGNRLLEHLVAALAESLLHAGVLERVGDAAYALTPRAFAHVERQPAHLRNADWHAGVTRLQLRRSDDDA